MKRLFAWALAAGAAIAAAGLPDIARAAAPQGFADRTAEVNGVRLHYMIGGEGSAVVLLHGYAQTSHMWRPVMGKLAKRHVVIVPDLRGAGASGKPTAGYDKKTMAQDIHALVASLGHERITIVGHDIGLMVAYAYAAQYPQSTERVVLMDAFLPGIGNWKDVWLLRDLWHFHFYGETPLALVTGRERIYFEHFWNDFAADRTRSVPEADRRIYMAAYAQPGGMRAGFEYFKAFEQDAADFAALSATKLTMPMLVLTGEKASGNFLIDQARLVATDVRGVVIKGSGHWLIDEAPQQVIPALVAFINEAPESGSVAGTSGVAGIVTQVLKGNPAQAGLYTLQLTVPANTRIESHSHPDDRVATVISGTWYFGTGDKFEERKLRELPAGSFYSEPPNEPHFARTGDTPVVVQITGFGPTGTRYVNRDAEDAQE